MSTIGHPLSDLATLTIPFLIVGSSLSAQNSQGQPIFQDGVTPGMPDYKTILKWYSEEVGRDVDDEADWAGAFAVFKCALIMQGIAARYALRQTSSAKAEGYADQMVPYSEIAYRMVQELRHHETLKSKM
jgi:aminoglycoside phosphotransferase (APT) family kinase protein